MSYIYLPECRSTNSEALRLIEQQEAKEGTYIYTDCQTAGRGQMNTHWEAAPGLNITASLILHPSFLPPARQFMLSIVAALGVYDFAALYLPAETLAIKWANDLLYRERKLSGILVQCVLQQGIKAAVVGVGFNVNQAHFETPRAVSLHQITGRFYRLEDLHSQLRRCLLNRYEQLRNGESKQLVQSYLRRLWRLHQPAPYRDKQGIFEGVIRGIDPYGRLIVEHKEKAQSRLYDIKEIEFL